MVPPKNNSHIKQGILNKAQHGGGETKNHEIRLLGNQYAKCSNMRPDVMCGDVSTNVIGDMNNFSMVLQNMNEKLYSSRSSGMQLFPSLQVDRDDFS